MRKERMFECYSWDRNALHEKFISFIDSLSDGQKTEAKENYSINEAFKLTFSDI